MLNPDQFLVPRLAIVAGTMLGLLAGCSRPAGPPSAAKAAAAMAAEPPEVTVTVPVEKPVRDHEDFTGRTEAVESVDVRARVTGFLQSTGFVDGDEISEQEAKDGKTLFVIDPRPFEADQKAARAELERARAARTLAAADLARVKTLRDKGQISAEEFDRNSAKKLEADADVQAAEAKLDQADLNVEFAHVRAPIAGRLSRAEITNGNLVNADTTKLTSIVSDDSMYVYFDVDERSMLRIQQMLREGKAATYKEARVPVYLALALDKGFPLEGYIDFVENRLDPNTGTIRVRAKFDNPLPERGPRVLSPGLFARVRLPLGPEYSALHIPEKAILTDQGQKFVYVVGKDNQSEYRKVVTGALRDGLRVIREGLSPGERVIESGVQRVRPGAPVRIAEPEKATSGKTE